MHPALLKSIATANNQQNLGYGNDAACLLATERIRTRFDTDADIHFASGGTQANTLCLSSMLRSYEGVIALASAHINIYEAGALETTGHKIITIQTGDGKLTPELIDEGIATHTNERNVMPRVVSLAQATELGTVYSREELFDVVGHAKDRGMFVYVDGARLGMGLASSGMQPAEIARSGIDMFYIGGTKNGGAFGEAIVIVNPALREHFRYVMVQRGAMLAKSVFIGLQFAAFFDEDDLWMKLGRVANDNARKLADGLDGLADFAQEVQTNQLFVNLPNDVCKQLQDRYGFYVWGAPGAETTTVRFVCSWATPPEMINSLIEDIHSAWNMEEAPEGAH